MGRSLCLISMEVITLRPKHFSMMFWSANIVGIELFPKFTSKFPYVAGGTCKSLRLLPFHKFFHRVFEGHEIVLKMNAKNLVIYIFLLAKCKLVR